MKITMPLPIGLVLTILGIGRALGSGNEELPPGWADKVPPTEFLRDIHGNVVRIEEGPPSAAFERVTAINAFVPGKVKKAVKILEQQDGREGIEHFFKDVHPDSSSSKSKIHARSRRIHRRKMRKDKAPVEGKP